MLREVWLILRRFLLQGRLLARKIMAMVILSNSYSSIKVSFDAKLQTYEVHNMQHLYMHLYIYSKCRDCFCYINLYIYIHISSASHYSSQEHATYGTSCLLPRFLNPTNFPVSNLSSINVILFLSPLSSSPSSFVGNFHRPPWLLPNRTYKEKKFYCFLIY